MLKTLLSLSVALILFSGCGEPELKPLKRVGDVKITVRIDGTLDAANTAKIFGLVNDLRASEDYYIQRDAIYIQFTKAI